MINLLHLPPTTLQPTLANADWDTFVQSASAAVADLAGAKHMLIAIGVLAVLYINLRLARWLSNSIKFDPPNHHHSHHH